MSKAPAAHLPEWTRVTDPELAWAAMVKARRGTWWALFGCYGHENGGLDLFKPVGRGDIACSQRSLATRIDGRRFVVVWWPPEPTEAPHVYHDTRVKGAQ